MFKYEAVKNSNVTHADGPDYCVSYNPNATGHPETAVIFELKSGRDLFVILFGDHRTAIKKAVAGIDDAHIVDALMEYVREHRI